MARKYEPEPGRLCRSLAGRDAGGYFIVVGIVDEDYVLIADGRTRRLASPKKKKRRHVHMTPIVLEDAAARLDTLQDGELRNMIKRTGRVENKEDTKGCRKAT